MTQTQTRIVLNPKYKGKAEQILEATGIDSLSQLFTLLLANYGDVLVGALKQHPQAMPASTQPPTPNAQPLTPNVQTPILKPQEAPQQKQFKPLNSF